MERFLDEQDEASLARSKQVRDSIKRNGRLLFQGIFQSTEEGRAIWRRVATRLSQTKIEITEQSGANYFLWELLRDPTTNAPLCLSAASFVHSISNVSQAAPEFLRKLKLLLVISRPDGTADVAFRTIASTIFEAIRRSARFEVVVLRPPTYAELARTLRDAATDGTPYDLVHFDGHGFYQDAGSNGSSDEEGGGHIVFEHDDADGGQAVSGAEFGALASECGVRAVVLNACRSAYQESSIYDDLRLSRPAASFAHLLLVAGVPAVVAMSFNVYVASAKRFMEEFYRQLERGQTLNVAASLARKHLSTDRNRFHQDSSEIDDWLVPTIYQNGPGLQMENQPEGETDLRSMTLPLSFPPTPDLGFIGSDDALLQIDRSFDSHDIVVVYGLAGAGKTATSIEFSSWYRATNPRTQTLLFSSFDQSTSLNEVLAGAEPEIGMRVRGLNLLEAEVQNQVILSLASKGTLWVWDNVETIGSMDEVDRQQFTAFLKRVNRSGLKLLLTARDPQENWLGDLACLVEMPDLRPSESVEFAKRLLSRRGVRKFDSNDWVPLLDFAGGNPLTLRVALSSHLTSTRKPSQASILSYVESLRRGLGQLGDAGGDDRARSLTASLNYGFENAFDANALKVLSLLSLFRTYVNSFTVWVMCRPITDPSGAGMPDHDFSWSIPSPLTESRQTIDGILNKATDLGLLRKTEDFNFWLHPAIHLHLRCFFDRSYPEADQRKTAERAYTEAEGLFSIQFTGVLQVGARAKAVEALTKEGDNLDHSLYLSHKNGWRQAEVGILHGLNALLIHQGRYEQWRMVFSSVWGDFIGPDLEPLPGTEKWWSFVLDHRLRIAMEDADLETAEPIARRIKKYQEENASAISKSVGSRYTGEQRKRLQDLAIATGRLADVLREKEEPESIAVNEEALTIYNLIEDKPGVAIRHLNLGHCYKNLEAIRDLTKSQEHYQTAYDNYPENDTLARGQCLAQISMIWVDRLEAQANGKPFSDELKERLDAAIEQYETALGMLPPDAWGDLANLHNQLANALRFDPDRQEEALDHARSSCEMAIAIGQYFEAATTRLNLAQLLAMMQRPVEAMAAAEQALTEYAAIGISEGEFIDVLRRIKHLGH